jgi:hypothetical protein
MKKQIYRRSIHRQIDPKVDNSQTLFKNYFIKACKLFWKVIYFAIVLIVAQILIESISQGPEAIHRIPEIPKAIVDTFNNVLDAYEIDKDLTGTWKSEEGDKDFKVKYSPIILEVECKDGLVSGSLYSRAVKKWTIYDMALVEGERKGDFLNLTIFDFIYGKYTELAKLKVQYKEDTNTITNHVPALVDSSLRVQTIWQRGSALPRNFTLIKSLR